MKAIGKELSYEQKIGKRIIKSQYGLKSSINYHVISHQMVHIISVATEHLLLFPKPKFHKLRNVKTAAKIC